MYLYFVHNLNMSVFSEEIRGGSGVVRLCQEGVSVSDASQAPWGVLGWGVWEGRVFFLSGKDSVLCRIAFPLGLCSGVIFSLSSQSPLCHCVPSWRAIGEWHVACPLARLP